MLLGEMSAFVLPLLKASIDVNGCTPYLHKPEAGPVPVYVEISVLILIKLSKSAGDSGVPDEKRLLSLLYDPLPRTNA